MSAVATTPVQKTIWHGIIIATPGTCGGKPRIDGTRIRVQDIYSWHEVHGKSVDEIVSDYPHLTHAGIYAALSYYWDHREEIHKIIDDDEKFAADFMKQNPSKLQEKLAQLHGQDHSVSS